MTNEIYKYYILYNKFSKIVKEVKINIYIINKILNNNNSLFRHLNNSINNSLKCIQIIILKKIITIKYVSSFFCGK